MIHNAYNINEPCTGWKAADLMCVSEHTGRRRLTRLRKEKGYKPKTPVSVGEFCEFYRLTL